MPAIMGGRNHAHLDVEEMLLLRGKGTVQVNVVAPVKRWKLWSKEGSSGVGDGGEDLAVDVLGRQRPAVGVDDANVVVMQKDVGRLIGLAGLGLSEKQGVAIRVDFKASPKPVQDSSAALKDDLRARLTFQSHWVSAS